MSPRSSSVHATRSGSFRFDGEQRAVTLHYVLEGPRLELRACRAGGRTHELVLDLAELLRVGERPDASWHEWTDLMTHSSPACRAGWGEAVRWFAGRLGLVAAFATSPRGTPSDARVASRLAEGSVHALVRALHERLDAAAWRGARAFAPDLQPWVYAQVAQDPSGRAAQLARTCPGAVLLAWAHARLFRDGRDPAHEWACGRIFADASRGLALKDLVRRATSTWMALLPDDVLARAVAREGEPEVLARRFRLLVRRAGPRVVPAWLTRPPLAFAPEDIPRHPAPNARWFFATAVASRELGRLPDPLRSALSRFVSRHPRVLRWSPGRHTDVTGEINMALDATRTVQRLVEFAGATGRGPAPGCDPDEHLRRAARWAAARSRASPVGQLAAALERIRLLGLGEVARIERHDPTPEASWRDGALRFPPAPGWRDAAPELTATPIRTAVELAGEARAMNHCAVTMLPALLAGELHLYAVQVDDERLTVAVRRRSGEPPYWLEQARGPSNVPPTARALRVVQGWVSRLRLAPGGA